jgi:hypothetical protein
MDIYTARFGEVPDVTGTVVKRSFCPPLEFFFGSSNFSNAEAYIASSSANFSCWDCSL